MILAKGAGGMSAVPLTAASDQALYRIERVSGSESNRKRLNEMGLVSGAEVSVVNRANGGMVVVKLGGCRLALDRAMASSVWVK